jgi:hemoglobin
LARSDDAVEDQEPDMAPSFDVPGTATAPTHPSHPTLFESLGGAATVQEVVRRFYDRILADPLLVPFFEGTDVGQLRRHQAQVVTGILGGPAEYDGIGLRAAHARLAIADGDYDRVGGHLLAVLGELGAGAEAEATVVAALDRARAEIVTVAVPGA